MADFCTVSTLAAAAVAVEVGGYPHLAMSQSLAGNLRVDAIGKEMAGVGVA
jgi:hypothetical protein